MKDPNLKKKLKRNGWKLQQILQEENLSSANKIETLNSWFLFWNLPQRFCFHSRNSFKLLLHSKNMPKNKCHNPLIHEKHPKDLKAPFGCLTVSYVCIWTFPQDTAPTAHSGVFPGGLLHRKITYFVKEKKNNPAWNKTSKFYFTPWSCV